MNASGLTAALCEPCCTGRSHEVRATGNYALVFTHFGHSVSGSMVWHHYYYGRPIGGGRYNASYSYLLSWRQSTNPGGTAANGTISVRVRAALSSRPMSNEAVAAARAGIRVGYTPATAQQIEEAERAWRTDIRARWSNRYVVLLRGNDCPGDLPIDFDFVRDERNPDIRVALYTMVDPIRNSGLPAAAFYDDSHLQSQVAKDLLGEYRSNAANMNLGDSRSELVASHEYGHWIGWGDEYVEDLTATRGIPGERAAVRFRNPTRVYQSARGTEIEEVPIKNDTVRPGLMASMGSPPGSRSNVRYFPRYVFNVVHDFIQRYNAAHRGRGAAAYCHDVRMTSPR